MNMHKLLLGLLLLFALPVSGAEGIIVSHAWVRLLPGDLPLAGYLEITNTGKTKLTLTGAVSPDFSDIEIHHSVDHGGEEEMVRVRSLDIGPGQTAIFTPGGYHLMMLARRRPLRVGDKVSVTLVFSDHERVLTSFKVRGAAA